MINYEQILSDILQEESTTTFWSGDTVTEPDIYRLEHQNQRWYYRLGEPIQFYTSITTFLKQVMPTAYFLEKWFKENDIEFLNERLKYSSNFGTLEHIMMGLFAKMGSIDLSGIDKAVDIYWAINELEPAQYLDELATKEQWTAKLKNDLLCIAAFFQEKNVEVIALEWMGGFDGSDEIPFSWCGQIDMVCNLDFGKGRKTAIVDLKTGSLHDDQVFQLIGNKLQWDQSNPDISIDLLMNLSPGKFYNKKKY